MKGERWEVRMLEGREDKRRDLPIISVLHHYPSGPPPYRVVEFTWCFVF